MGFSRKTQFLQNAKRVLGSNNAIFVLSSFGWLQSALKIISASGRVDVSLEGVAQICRGMIEKGEVCFPNLWAQRLRLAGLVAHIERAYGLLKTSNTVREVYFFPNE